MDEVRSGMPRRDVQLDQAVARYSEGYDVLDARARLVTKVAWRRYADQPFLAAERTQALGDPPVSCDPREAKPDMRQMHEPQPWLAIAQNEICLAGRGLRIIAGLRALAACSQGRNDLAVWRECLRRQLPDVQHVPWQRARIVHCRPSNPQPSQP